MKFLFSKILPRKMSVTSLQQARLSLARFRHFLHQYGRILALSADAADKQSGEYILDQAYVMALSDRALETAEAMIYDVNALAGNRHADLYDFVEAIRHRTAELFEQKPTLRSTVEDANEEREYRLLKRVRAMLCLPEDPAALLSDEAPNSNLFAVAHLAQRAACDYLAELMQSILAKTSNGTSFPIRTCVVDIAGSLANLRSPLHPADPLSVDSIAAREFLTAFFSPTLWEGQPCEPAALDSTGLLVSAFEESVNALLLHKEEYYLFDAALGCATEANYIYCRLPSGSGKSASEKCLAQSGFLVSSTEKEFTAWVGSKPLSEGTATLKMIARIAAYLLQTSACGMAPTEENLYRVLQAHDHLPSSDTV